MFLSLLSDLRRLRSETLVVLFTSTILIFYKLWFRRALLGLRIFLNKRTEFAPQKTSTIKDILLDRAIDTCSRVGNIRDETFFPCRKQNISLTLQHRNFSFFSVGQQTKGGVAFKDINKKVLSNNLLKFNQISYFDKTNIN